ncbi:MAG: molybdopterin-dependent oxidoreductase [Acidimicrobiia bacterium]
MTVDPLNVGVEPTRLDGDPLSQSHMYRRSNFPIPSQAPDGFDVNIPGAATRHLTVARLAIHAEVRLDMVLECAGNGRALMSPVPNGTPWGLDAVSPITVRGARLRDVLGDMSPRVECVVFTGADVGTIPGEGTQPYQFSIGRELAESPDPILATHIDEEPLTLEHGAPVRLIVPGHYAMKSVKWLTRIDVLEHEFDGHFVRKYRYYEDESRPQGAAVGEIAVRSIISSHVGGATVPAGKVDVLGSAWSGVGAIVDVEVSANAGQEWREARLSDPAGRFGPVKWSATFELEPGSATLMARATDAGGLTQPLEARWNANGYANNVVQRVEISVR